MADEVIGAQSGRRVQQRRARHDGWTQKRRKQFLDALAGSCNVRKAAAAAGLHASNAYALRQRDPAFADLWKEALALGYERLEEALLEHALRSMNAIEIDPLDTPPLGQGPAAEQAQPGSGAIVALSTKDVQLALLLLNRHRGTVEGRGKPAARRRATPEETNAALRKQLDVLARKLRAAEK